MGRRKMEMKRIEDKSSRQVTFSKRRTGLIKKARELSILCDVELALLVFSSRGRLYDFCSGQSLTSIVERYKSHTQEASTSKAAGDGPGCESDNAGTRSYTELLQIVESFTQGSDAEDTMSGTDLVQLENEFSSALQKTRSRKKQLLMESIMTLKEKDRLLREEKEMLEREVASLLSNDAAANCGGQNSKRYKGNDHQDDYDDPPIPPKRLITLNLFG